MAVAGLPPSVRVESLLRVACAVMSAAAALLLGLSSQTKTVLFVQKKAVSKEVQALWVLIMATASASGYQVAQLATTLYLGRFAGDGGCRRAMACVSFFLDKGCAYMVFATTVAALQACMIALNGVDALQWSKLCNIYMRFCEQVAAGMFCSLLAAGGMAVLSVLSAREHFRRRP